MSGTYAVETSGLSKRFGARVAVDNLDLRVPRGSAFGYLGPNGAGKTTLIRLLLGLTRATSGMMRLLGHPIPAERAAALPGGRDRRGAALPPLPDRPREPRRDRRRTRARGARPDRGRACAGWTRRAGGRARLPYSLGMRQRLGVARALLADPELLILDEPTNGLDPAGIHEFRGMIRGLVAEGRTVLLSSHLLDEVEKICDAVAIVDHGRVVMQGSLAELKGDRQTILIGSGDGVRVQALLAAHPAVRSAAKTPEGIRITLRPGYPLSAEDAAADINRFLVEAGLAVHRVEPAPASLEERFLELTSRLGVAA